MLEILTVLALFGGVTLALIVSVLAGIPGLDNGTLRLTSQPPLAVVWTSMRVWLTATLQAGEPRRVSQPRSPCAVS